MTTTIRLQSGMQRLELVPAIGGSIAAFFAEGPGGRIDWMRPMPEAARAAGDVLEAACFPLFPFSNRIRGKAFAFAGTVGANTPLAGTGSAEIGRAHV